MRRLALLLVILAPSIPRPTGACSLASRDGGSHQVDPAHTGDLVLPSQVNATYQIDRPSGGGGVGCAADCGPGPAYLMLELSATDDRTATVRLGYRFEILGGDPPRNLYVADDPMLVDMYGGPGNLIGLAFDRDDHDFSFDLQITAVDLNGNEGPPVVITIES